LAAKGASQPLKVYDELAIVAGREAGIVSTEQARAATTDDDVAAQLARDVAQDKATRAQRDELWAELERRLRDTHTYTLDDIHAWLEASGAHIGRTSVHRARLRLLANERAIRQRAELARAVIEAAGDGGANDILTAGMQVAAQHVFDALNAMPPIAAENMTVSQMLNLLEITGRLHTARAQADYTDQRVAELGRKFDEALAARQSLVETGGRRELTAEDIRAIRESVFGVAVDAA